jgi:hypothetical protein
MHDLAFASTPVAARACRRNSSGRLNHGRNPEAPTFSAMRLDKWLPPDEPGCFFWFSFWFSIVNSIRPVTDQWL